MRLLAPAAAVLICAGCGGSSPAAPASGSLTSQLKLQCAPSAGPLQCTATTGASNDVTRDAQWSTDDPQIAAVDAGAVRAMSAGDTVLRVRWTAAPSPALEAFVPVVVLPGMQPMPAFEISGLVRATDGRPLTGAQIEIVAGHVPLEGRTASTGLAPPFRPGFVETPVAPDYYRLLGVPPGLYVLRASKDGYRAVTALVEVEWTASRNLNFALPPL